ncbi:MAG: diacylglycerol kinase family protein [Spirochaetia bacterium]|nr:diacylglycerol kinase family protein [Spirochaetia bacterium]
MKKNIILMNPSSGQSRAMQSRKILEDALRKYRINYELYASDSESHFRLLAHQHIKNAKTMSSAGGDSTFTILVNEMMKAGTKIPLGIIPLGSSDDIAREFNIYSIEDAVSAIAGGKTIMADIGKISDHEGFEFFFAGQANVGIGVFVNRFVANYQKKGIFFRKNQTVAGLLGMSKAFRYKFVPARFFMDTGDISMNEEFISILFSKIKYWVTGRIFLPEAGISDGKLHMLFIKKCGFFRLLRIMILASQGKHIDQKTVQYFACESAQIGSEQPFLIQVDGDIIMERGEEKYFQQMKVEAINKAIEIIIL